MKCKEEKSPEKEKTGGERERRLDFSQSAIDSSIKLYLEKKKEKNKGKENIYKRGRKNKKETVKKKKK